MAENKEKDNVVESSLDEQAKSKAKEKAKKQSEKNSKIITTTKKSRRSPVKWFKEARAEFRKVTWPTPKQVVKNTSIVLTMLVIAGVSIWGLDKLLDFVFGFVMAR